MLLYLDQVSWVNLISAVIIIVVVYFLMPHILGFDISDTLNLK